MGKGKEIKLFRIFQATINEHNIVISYRPTKAALTSEEEARKYCEYLNNTNNFGESNVRFYFEEESMIIFKKAHNLVVSEQEDAILFD